MTEEQIKQNAEEYADGFITTAIFKRHLCDAYIEGAHSRDREVEMLQNQIGELSEQHAENIQKLRNPWISVEDRLPEEGQIVFVHMQGGSTDSAIYTNGAFERSLQLKFGMIDNGYTTISWQQRFKSNITHWMPIPELPKGGEA